MFFVFCPQSKAMPDILNNRRQRTLRMILLWFFNFNFKRNIDCKFTVWIDIALCLYLEPFRWKKEYVLSIFKSTFHYKHLKKWFICLWYHVFMFLIKTDKHWVLFWNVIRTKLSHYWCVLKIQMVWRSLWNSE